MLVAQPFSPSLLWKHGWVLTCLWGARPRDVRRKDVCGTFRGAFLLCSSILNLPGESTLRRDFLRLQLANKERSEALRRQQLEQQQRENEEHKRQLLAERQKRIEEQKEQRRRLEEVSGWSGAKLGLWELCSRASANRSHPWSRPDLSSW